MEPPNSPKIRLMCSFNGRFVPRLTDKSLIYEAGETKILAFDRRSAAAKSLAALTSQISAAVYQNQPFHLKYKLPNLDVDSLIDVVTDEDLEYMIDEYDRINAPRRIRLFLFPIKPPDLKSERLLLLKNAGSDSGLLVDIGSDCVVVGSGAESMVLEMSSSFGSSGSSTSMPSPPLGCYEDSSGDGLSLMDKPIRVPSSDSIMSDFTLGTSGSPPKTDIFEEPLIQIDDPEPSSFFIASENTASDTSISAPLQSSLQGLVYPVSQQSDGSQIHNEPSLGGLQYISQYPVSSVPVSPYYPYYQMPMQQQQQQQIYYPPNQQYPMYLVPVPACSVPMPYSFINTTTTTVSRAPLHPQIAVISPRHAQAGVIGVAESTGNFHLSIPATMPLVSVPSNQGLQDLFGAQKVAEPTTNFLHSIPATSPLISIPSDQAQKDVGVQMEAESTSTANFHHSIPSDQAQLITGFSEKPNLSEPVTNASVASSEFDEDIVYKQIYKSQPSAPALFSQYLGATKGVGSMLSESSSQLQQNHTKQQAAIHLL